MWPLLNLPYSWCIYFLCICSTNQWISQSAQCKCCWSRRRTCHNACVPVLQAPCLSQGCGMVHKMSPKEDLIFVASTTFVRKIPGLSLYKKNWFNLQTIMTLGLVNVVPLAIYTKLPPFWRSWKQAERPSSRMLFSTWLTAILFAIVSLWCYPGSSYFTWGNKNKLHCDRVYEYGECSKVEIWCLARYSWTDTAVRGLTLSYKKNCSLDDNKSGQCWRIAWWKCFGVLV